MTAQKTSEAASRTPIALSVFTGKDLQEAGVASVANLTAIAPSVVVGSSAQGVNISVRGVQTTDVTSKGEQSIVFNVDGIAIARPQIIGLAFFDLDRVEVLRGPQGTLYGKSSTGGAINVITAKPTDQFGASASVELGNYNTRRIDAMINVPLSDTFALRAAFNSNQRDGYLYPVLGNTATSRVEANLNDENNWTGRLTARWNYLPNGSLVVTGTFGHIGGTGNVNNGILYNRFVSMSGKAQRDVYYNPMAGSLNDHYHIVNAELNQDLGPVHLTYDGAHISFTADDNKFASTGDPAGAPGAAAYLWSQYRADITQESHELRLSNSRPGTVEWVLGANYNSEKVGELDRNWQTLAACAPSLAASCNIPNPVIIGTTRHKSEGVFGQINVRVADRLKLTAGLRYSHDEASRDANVYAGGGTFLGADGQPCGPLNLCASGGTNNSGRFSGNRLTYRAGIDFQATPTDLLYASVATGYKPGSFNDVDPARPGSGATPYGSESLTAYEIGYKGRPLRNLQFNTSAYYYDYSRFQLTGATFLTPSATGGPPIVLIYTTVVPVKMWGWENELNWRPSKSDTIGLGWTVEGGHYSGPPGSALVGFIFSNRQDFTGNRLDLLPTFTARLSYEHRFYMSDGGYFHARASSSYNNGYFVSDVAGSGNPFSGVYDVLPTQYKQKSFTRTDLSFGYTSASGRVSIEAFVRNLENKLQMLGAPQGINPPGPGLTPPASYGGTADRTTVRVSDPRFMGVRLSVRY